MFVLENKKKKKYSSATYTTGDIGLNIDNFNKRMGTYVHSNDNNNPSTVEAQAEAAAENVAATNTAGGASCADCGGEAGASISEDLDVLQEDAVYANKVGEYVDIPDEIKLVQRKDVKDFLGKLDPEEPFKVAYITPLYFYKKFWDAFTILKCTVLEGYTGVDYRDVRSSEADKTADRIEKAKLQMAGKNADDYQVKSKAVKQSYDQINKTVSRRSISGDWQDGQIDTILFYPDVTKKPKVWYYLSPNADGNYVQIGKTLLEQTVFKKLRELIAADNAIEKLGNKVVAKIQNELDTDNKTNAKVVLSSEDKYEYSVNNVVSKPQVRALYTNQVFYLKNITTGEQIGQIPNNLEFAESLEEEANLDEATKRYIKRYYIRPQNIFCSNKEDILKALVEIGDENCSVYSLKSLADHDDVHKLTSKDIIYYYDDNVLYDKNHVKVMDYDLFVKHEEERRKFASDVEDIPDRDFAKEYEDRLTTATTDDTIKVKQATHEDINQIIDDNPFNESFVNINAYGHIVNSLKEAIDEVCCICGEEIEGYGNNADPYKDGYCCDACNLKFVIPARLARFNAEDEE